MQDQIKIIIEKYRGEWNSQLNRFDFPCFFKTEEAKKELRNLLGDQIKIIDGDSGDFQPWIKIESFEYDPYNIRSSVGEMQSSA